MKHGTYGGYRWGHRCRCENCTAAHRDAVRRESLARYELTAANGGVAPVDPHGTTSTYVNWGCRCRPCAEANSAACAARRKARAARASAVAVTR